MIVTAGEKSMACTPEELLERIDAAIAAARNDLNHARVDGDREEAWGCAYAIDALQRVRKIAFGGSLDHPDGGSIDIQFARDPVGMPVYVVPGDMKYAVRMHR